MRIIWRWIIGVLAFLILCGIGIWFVLAKPIRDVYITNAPTTITQVESVPGAVQIMDVPGPVTTLPPVTIAKTRLYPYDITTTVTTTEPRFITTTQPIYVVTTQVVTTTLAPVISTVTTTVTLCK